MKIKTIIIAVLASAITFLNTGCDNKKENLVDNSSRDTNSCRSIGQLRSVDTPRNAPVQSGDWQNENLYSAVFNSDPEHIDLDKKIGYRLGHGELSQDAYAIARYGRQDQYFQITRALTERMLDITNGTDDVKMYVFKNNLLNLPVLPPGEKVTIEEWNHPSLCPYKENETLRVIYTNNTIGCAYNINTLRTKFNGGYRRLEMNSRVVQLCNICIKSRISFAFHPFGVFVFRKSELTEECGHMFNSHFKRDGNLEQRKFNKIQDQLIWGEFVAGYAGLKADGWSRNYDFGNDGQFDAYYNAFCDNGNFTQVKGSLPKESVLLLQAIYQAKQAISGGTATPEQTRAVSWASNSSVGRKVL